MHTQQVSEDVMVECQHKVPLTWGGWFIARHGHQSAGETLRQLQGVHLTLHPAAPPATSSVSCQCWHSMGIAHGLYQCGSSICCHCQAAWCPEIRKKARARVTLSVGTAIVAILMFVFSRHCSHSYGDNHNCSHRSVRPPASTYRNPGYSIAVDISVLWSMLQDRPHMEVYAANKFVNIAIDERHWHYNERHWHYTCMFVWRQQQRLLAST